MATENCSSAVLQLDTHSWSGDHWGLSTPDLLAFETDALVRVLAGSTLPNPPDAPLGGTAATPSSSSRSSTFFPCSPSPTASNSASTFTATPASSSAGSPFLPSRSTSPRLPAVAAGRVSKRKPRRVTSRTTAISYIETDPARFRDMVQQMTGFRMPPPAPAPHMQMTPYQPTMQMNNNGYQQWSAAPMASMPTLDTSDRLLNAVTTAPVQLPQEQILSAPGSLDSSFDHLLANLDFGDELLMIMPEFPQQQQQHQPKPLPPCFPTLESSSD